MDSQGGITSFDYRIDPSILVGVGDDRTACLFAKTSIWRQVVEAKSSPLVSDLVGNNHQQIDHAHLGKLTKIAFVPAAKPSTLMI